MSSSIETGREGITTGLRQAATILRFALTVVFVFATTGVRAASPSELDLARENLAAARVAYQAAVVEYRELLGQGALSPTEQDDYADYLIRLSRAIITSCERLYTLSPSLPDASVQALCSIATGSGSAPVSFPEEVTEGEHVAKLDGQLGALMSEFDELLLREMEELRKRRSGSPDGGSGSEGAEGDYEGTGSAAGSMDDPEKAGDGAGGETADGSTPGESEEQGSTEASGETQDQESQSQGDGQVASREQGNGQQQQGASGSKSSGGGPPGKSDDPPGAGDDDIVARQLREAAEKETDPVLREKLWEEYRRYKAGTTAKTTKNEQ